MSIRILYASQPGYAGILSLPIDIGYGDVRQVDLPVFDMLTNAVDTPSFGTLRFVPAGGNLQAAIDASVLGDIIMLQAGAEYVGNFHLREKTTGLSGQYIRIISNDAIPPEHVRLTRDNVGSYNPPKITTPNSAPALDADDRASNYRIMGIEFAANSATSLVYNLISLGGPITQLNNFPKNLIIDRCFIHGREDLESRRGIALNSWLTAVIDCTIVDFHSVGFDTQAIAGTNGPGGYLVENCRMEASSEVISFGGADPFYAGHNPSDIIIRRCHITRPMIDKPKPYLEKNMIEFKCGVRVLIEANVIENSWADDQLGWVGVFWSVNQNNTNPTVETAHVTFRKNLIRNCSAGFQLTQGYYDNGVLRTCVPLHHVAIYHNVFIGMDNPAIQGGSIGFYIGNAINDISIEHNTFFIPTLSVLEFTVPLGQRCNNLWVRNNLMGGGSYPVYMVVPRWVDQVSGDSRFEGNVVGFANAQYFADVFQLPPNNSYPTTEDTVKLVGGASKTYDVTATPADLALSAASPYKGRATDGLDPGADEAMINLAVAGVV